MTCQCPRIRTDNNNNKYNIFHTLNICSFLLQQEFVLPQLKQMFTTHQTIVVFFSTRSLLLGFVFCSEVTMNV